jgi:hypothetical protein
MTERDAFADRRRGLEEEYFRKREQELIDKMRRRAAQDAARQGLAERTGVADKEILDDLVAMGYTPETVMLLHLVPLLKVAWAEGGVSDRERQLIVEAARARGIAPGTAADRQLQEWLSSAPSDQVFDAAMKAIRPMLQAASPGGREAGTRDLLSYSAAIASASGGILGFGKVSEEERQLLARITEELTQHHGAEATRVPEPPDEIC